MSKNVLTLKSGSEVTQGYRKWYHLIFLLVFYSNFVHKMHRFFRYSTCNSIQWPWNPGYWSLKVIGTDMNRCATYDFLLTFYSKHGLISYRFRDIRQFQTKIAKFSHPILFCIPAEGVPLELCTNAGVQKTRMMGLPGRQRSLKYLQPSG